MEELRENIIANLDELRNKGLSESRYELYVDIAYRCEDVEELLELAALELQMEANEFFLQFREQLREGIDDDEITDYEDLVHANSDGFGDENEDLYSAFSSDERTDVLNQDELDEEIDPKLFALQQALLGADASSPETDPDYFDIDSLLSGGIPPQTNSSEQTSEYKDALAELLAAYPLSDEGADVVDEIDEGDETESIGLPVQTQERIVSGFDSTSGTSSIPSNPQGNDALLGFGKPANNSERLGFPEATPSNVAVGFTPSFANEANQNAPSIGFPTRHQPNLSNSGTVQKPSKTALGEKEAQAQVGLKEIFNGFSKRKT